ncbi:hypothetical protein BC830DRAFT_355251 [Chytriomyces sp. MP71]|nr:hypothetical protein BC830DRAFT_355251 [Chytriomyces sp. MP71]
MERDSPAPSADASSQNLFCYVCRLQMAQCKCAPKRQPGEDMQLVVPAASFPPETAGVVDNIHFWADELIPSHVLAGRWNSRAFASDFIAKVGIIQHMDTASSKVAALFSRYSMSNDFSSMAPKLNNMWTVEQLRRIGSEALDSFFSGRWWELSAIHIVVIMNTFETSKLDPKLPQNKDLTLVAQAIQGIMGSIVSTSNRPGFTIVAPSCSARMKKMAVFEPIMSF